MASFLTLLARRIPPFVLAGAMLAGPTLGQTGATVPNVVNGLDSNGGQKLSPVGSGATGAVPMPVTISGSASAPVPTIPPPLTAFGTLAVTTSSVALSTLTVGPNSAAWSTTLPNKYVTVRNSVNSTAVLYFCAFGGTCTSSVGEPIAIGETVVRQLASPATPTLICGTAAACTVIGEE
jgi:hypothetical protein